MLRTRYLAPLAVAACLFPAAAAANPVHTNPAVDGLEPDRTLRPWLSPDPAPIARTASQPYLGKGEACRQLGRFLHRDFEYGAMTGSLECAPWRYRRNIVRGGFCFDDYDLDTWCGTFRIRETWASYFYRWNVDLL